MSLYDHVDAVILRDPVHHGDTVICPECGKDITDTKGSGEARVPLGTLLDTDLASILDAPSLPTHGWVCNRHNYAVVCPAHTTSDGGNIGAGWTGVPVELADGRDRRVPVPRKEVAQQ